MNFSATTARTLLLAAVVSIAAAGCGKRGDDAGAATGTSSGGSTSSDTGSTGGSPSSGAATASSPGATNTDAGTSGATGSGTAASAGTAIDDSIITTKLKTALLADTTLKGTDISVETRSGEVSLTGFVTSPAQKDHAAKIAQALSGVKNVDNKLALKK